MINELLVALTGKTTGFSCTSLNVLQEFTPVKDASVDEVRQILTGGEEKWALTLIWFLQGAPVASLGVPRGIWSTDFTDTPFPGGTVTGATLIANGNGPAAVTRNTLPMTWPFTSSVTVTYSSDKAVTIKVGDLSYSSRITMTGNRMSIEWPAGVGINGDLLLDASYGPYTAVSIDVAAPYPHAQVEALLRASEAFYDVLARADLVDSFYFADDARECTAIAALALYRVFHAAQAE